MTEIVREIGEVIYEELLGSYAVGHRVPVSGVLSSAKSYVEELGEDCKAIEVLRWMERSELVKRRNKEYELLAGSV